MDNFFTQVIPPDTISADTGETIRPLLPTAGGWQAGDVVVQTELVNDALRVTVSSERTPIERVHLRWRVRLAPGVRLIGDAWERAYGDLEWRGVVPERIMPWYFLAYDGLRTFGCGVKTQPGAMCFWMMDPAGVSLWLDTRCGGTGVLLGGRALLAAEVITHAGRAGESPFATARAFCRRLSPKPRMPDHPVYGSNNWYYAYGQSDHNQILADTRLVADLAPQAENRPYMVIDAGWQPGSGEERATDIITGGPYQGSNPRFPDMAALAAQMKELGTRPGIWLRPLAATPDDPVSALLPVARAVDATAMTRTADPSIPEVIERIREDFHTLRGWGYDLIKHDWSTCDLLGRWGFQMGAALTNPGWRFADPTRTTAEITLALYRAIRDGAGDAVVIGCNTVGHLCAGLFELNRTGDDTSGREWERTRKYGINTLAFRACQHGSFFAADADCMGDSPSAGPESRIPWEQNAQFLDLLARSGTPLFVSVDPRRLSAAQELALRDAFHTAAEPQPLCEPLDWMETTCPSVWRVRGETVQYNWFEESGTPPLTGSIPIWWGT
jgi:alpha-galactosidase